MKNGNFYQRIKSARKELRVAYAKHNRVLRTLLEESDSAILESMRGLEEKFNIKLFEEDQNGLAKTKNGNKIYDDILSTIIEDSPVYNEAKKEVSKKRGDLLHLSYDYYFYASFVNIMITDFFAEFLSYVEGEKFVAGRNVLDTNEITMIIKEDVAKQYDTIDYYTIDKLYRNGDLILLTPGMNASYMVYFYDLYGKADYKLGSYNYLKEFIFRLIQYRIDNGKKDYDSFTVEDLYSFTCEFLLKHPDLVTKNKDKRNQMVAESKEDNSLFTLCKKLELN